MKGVTKAVVAIAVSVGALAPGVAVADVQAAACWTRVEVTGNRSGLCDDGGWYRLSLTCGNSTVPHKGPWRKSGPSTAGCKPGQAHTSWKVERG